MILTQNNEYAAVLDACVLAPMPLCDTLLRLAEDPAFYRPLWSDEILQEVGDVLVHKLGLTTTQRDRRLRVMREEFPEALVRIPRKLPATFDCGGDKDDRHVLAAAVKGQAHAIITSNTKDFLKECLDEYGILCQTPDDFLVHQFHLNPPLVLEKLDQQGASIGRGRLDIVQRLRIVAPQFSDLVQEYSP